MKKVLFLVPVILLGGLLCSCNNNQPTGNLSYSFFSKENNPENRIKFLTYDGLNNKVNTKKESILVVLYKGKGCTCWPEFQSVMKAYNEKYHGWFYAINVSEFDGRTDRFNLQIPTDDTVSLSIFKEGTLAKQWIKTSSNKDIFNDVEELRKAITSVINDAKYIYADESGLDYLIETNATLSIYFAKTNCPDCTAMETEMLFPYAENHTLKNNFYFFDVATYLDAEGNPGPRYQEIKDKYGLSIKNNPTLGFTTGVMPTLQYIENKVIKDMAVIYNDTISKNENDSYTISESYYDEGRYKSLSFIKDVQTKVLQGINVPKDEVTEIEYKGQIYYSWKREGQNKYHKPIFEAFMNTYITTK